MIYGVGGITQPSATRHLVVALLLVLLLLRHSSDLSYRVHWDTHGDW